MNLILEGAMLAVFLLGLVLGLVVLFLLFKDRPH
jgi:hypothetical protein